MPDNVTIKDYLNEIKKTIDAKFTYTHARLDILNDDINEIKELQKVANGRLGRAEEDIDKVEAQIMKQALACKYVQDKKKEQKVDFKYIITTIIAFGAAAIAIFRQ